MRTRKCDGCGKVVNDNAGMTTCDQWISVLPSLAMCGENRTETLDFCSPTCAAKHVERVCRGLDSALAS